MVFQAFGVKLLPLPLLLLPPPLLLPPLLQERQWQEVMQLNKAEKEQQAELQAAREAFWQKHKPHQVTGRVVQVAALTGLLSRAIVASGL
jgi:hypothetical protein